MAENIGTEQEQQPPAGNRFQAVVEHMKSNMMDSALWISRLLTIIFSIGYIIPLFGNPTNCYYKVLMANGVTSAIRLRQRLPHFQLSREYLQLVLVEDSCHYLFYTLIFLSVQPVILIIFPVVLFAVLHSASYTLTLLDIMGHNAWWGARLIISLVEFQTRNILRFAAFAEVFCMPLVIMMVFIGKAGIMTPFVYYQFLMFRYSSRRNPYTRNVFHEIRLKTEMLANSSKTPTVVKKLIVGGISFVSRLAPPMPPQQQQ